ncbi:kexin KEX2 NDAI_0F03890 [Naumovozyma dairenensis CBS 421]|uniref:P/Homo B domain-containing protein n=1 Tax=Naumovozyma dairenensis (strain ATCC 10597 / BCRC 20456 / CBS 421 / NBRC 0211 / NRRL Y-12639) TaxID=1071378 RepID=G0WD46_NAUDC|nr:hypothetical protein NDAI_0F03890 [Naumovozyma dairenensis CBS 421]CCD25707.1 hypothetical protein NDAI_0F03890 [Naumovozyma dairenensis CBS 421]
MKLLTPISNSCLLLCTLLTSLLFLTTLTMASDSSSPIPSKDHNTKQYFAIETELTPQEILQDYPNWQYEHPARGIPNHYVFSRPLLSITNKNNLNKRSLANEEADDESILSFQDLPSLQNHLFKRAPVPPLDSSLIPIKDVQDKLRINDPSFPKQWHLINPEFPGNDVNVKKLWYENITGEGIVVAIVDDGLDYENPDLKDNFSAEGSWDFNDNTQLPKPRLADDYHGTRCAGEIAATKDNGFCGIGVAYNAKVAGIRILSGELTAEDEAASLVHALDVNDIYSCSWGPKDDGTHLQGPTDLVKKAMIRGTSDGRDKKGAIYVFASGNGGAFGDNCNYDGYTNSIYSITIGALDHKGLHPPYSESCSAVMAVTYSSGSGEYIHSTDIGNKCSDHHGGTSAAAPLAAGIFSLVLQVNPNLTWRDLQYISILSSKQVNVNDGNWNKGALGKPYSHKYGYGKIDAYEMANLARDWENVNAQSWFYSKTHNVSKSTNVVADTLQSSIKIDKQDLEDANLKRIEHVTVTVHIDTVVRGATTIDLVSPDGMVSNLGVIRKRDVSSEGFQDWTFMSVAHWGESGVGEWKLKVRTTQEGNEVKFKTWRIKLFGESIDSSKAERFIFGNDKEEEENNKGVSETVSSPILSATDSTSITSTAVPSITISPTSTNTSPEDSEGMSSDTDPNVPNKLPSPEQAMHYFITLFVLGAIFLLIYSMFFVKSRRRIRRSRAEAYEFDIIDSDSDYDSTFDGSLASNPGLADASTHVDDFDFDLSDEDHLSSDLANTDSARIDGILQENPFKDASASTDTVMEPDSPTANDTLIQKDTPSANDATNVSPK